MGGKGLKNNGHKQAPAVQEVVCPDRCRHSMTPGCPPCLGQHWVCTQPSSTVKASILGHGQPSAGVEESSGNASSK